MRSRLGEKLVDEKMITEQQITEALRRQRLHGGRLGQNLVALGFLTKNDLDRIVRTTPPTPKRLADTGLDFSVLEDLTMKHILFMGEFSLSDVADRMKVANPIVETLLQTLRRQELVASKGGTTYAAESFTWKITEQGKNRARELFEICRYAGPAPVTLDDYRDMIISQSIADVELGEEEVRNAFSNLVLSNSFLKRIGPAVCSGRPMFIYGPAGNGKTAIAEAVGEMLPDTVFIPYSIIVGGQIISVFDPVNHSRIEEEVNGHSFDPRWVLSRRPIIVTGGELTMSMLELDFNPIAKYYEAPLQMKANNGLFIADDFGRQQADPRSLFNRWIVPLERRIDFLSLHTGMKFEIPFDELVIFSSNIHPNDLVEEAFLRRIRYKFKIGHPSEPQYEAIFRKVCRINGIEFREDAFRYLITNHYKRTGTMFSACHPRDLMDQIIDDAHFHRRQPQLTPEAIDHAWENYFGDFDPVTD